MDLNKFSYEYIYTTYVMTPNVVVSGWLLGTIVVAITGKTRCYAYTNKWHIKDVTYNALELKLDATIIQVRSVISFNVVCTIIQLSL